MTVNRLMLTVSFVGSYFSSNTKGNLTVQKKKKKVVPQLKD